MSRTGRRPGKSSTRSEILNAARRCFGARGYNATTIRVVAEAAGVDPALVVHYFGNKEGLFVAALALPIRPSQAFGDLAELEPDEAAERIVRTFLGVLAGNPSGDAFLALIRSAVSDERVAGMLREFVTEELLTLVARVAGRRDARLGAALVAAQLVGLALLRHVVRIEALVRASDEDVVALVAPVVALYLTNQAQADH